MRSVTCSSCGLVGWAENDNCKRCGQPFVFKQPPINLPPPTPPQQQQTHQAPPPTQSFGGAPKFHGPHDYYGATPSNKRTGHAVASLAIGIVGLFSLGILLIGSIVGTLLGIVALKKEGSDPARYGGKGLAIGGIALNIAAVLTIIPFALVAAIAVPNLLAARRAANEASAISNLHKIGMAETTYGATNGYGSYGSLSALAAVGLIDEELSRGTKYGYNFVVTTTERGYEAVATPITYGSSGTRSFYVSEDGKIHVGLNNGMPATANDPTLDSFDSFRGSEFPQPRVSQPRQSGFTSQPALLPGR